MKPEPDVSGLCGVILGMLLCGIFGGIYLLISRL